MKFLGTSSKMAVGVCLMTLLYGCTALPVFKAGPEPGTVGFYEVKPVKDKAMTDDVTARRMSQSGDVVYVYRLNDDMVVLGNSVSSAVKPFDEITRGVVITPEGAKRLAAYLSKVIAQYDKTDKAQSVYLDFRLLTEEVVKVKDDEIKNDVIQVRFQYVYNYGIEKSPETTNYYLGGGYSASPKLIAYNDIKILLANLQKP